MLQRRLMSMTQGGDVINIEGHDAVDLGGSVYWATCNLGANSPEERGNYFVWGDTEPHDKSYFYWNSYWDSEERNQYFLKLKYCGLDNSGNIIYTKYLASKNTLQDSDDAACVLWGGGWRMPTEEELLELYDNCFRGIGGKYENDLAISFWNIETKSYILLPFPEGKINIIEWYRVDGYIGRTSYIYGDNHYCSGIDGSSSVKRLSTVELQYSGNTGTNSDIFRVNGALIRPVHPK